LRHRLGGLPSKRLLTSSLARRLGVTTLESKLYKRKPSLTKRTHGDAIRRRSF
jgi:hypothetical protein